MKLFFFISTELLRDS